ncbi:hypothetical protein [Haloferula sp.]|uniref:hypothetical protein n=1 Tax=Haloferula sp. TaxID=2497595 RepID=UPI00329BECA9
MRRFLISLNGVIAGFFLLAFAYSFIAKGHLTTVARDFATSKTVDYAAPIVELAEETAQSKAVKLVLSKSQEAAVADEFANYHSDPLAYISTLTGKAPAKELKLPKNPLSEKIKGGKDSIRSYYNKVIGRILKDLRIFSGTNLAAALISFFLAFKARREVARPLIWLSGLLCVATCISIYGFVDTFSFYQYLFNWQMGWSYPAVVFLSYLYLVSKLYQHRNDPV